MAALGHADGGESPIYNYPGGKARSKVWDNFGFFKLGDGPVTKENLDMTRAVCRLCRKIYANKGNTTNLQFHLSHDHAAQDSGEKQGIKKEKAKLPTDQSTPVLDTTSKEDHDVAVDKQPETSPAKKIAKIRPADTDEWLEDVMCIGESVQPVQDIIVQEVSRYLGAAHTDHQLTLLEWWKKNATFFPRVSLLARKYLAIASSSVPSERVFSLAGHLVNKKRARLSPKNVDMIIFLRKNMELYW